MNGNAPPPVHAGGADDLVILDKDHPGFRDAAYRKRRNTIARLALEYHEPDVVHELIGHAVTFVHPEFAKINRLFGQAALRSNEAGLARIARVYWYTLEFGAVMEDGMPRAYGAGLLSSGGELERLGSGVPLKAFNLDEVAETVYDPTEYQPHYFVAGNFAEAMSTIAEWLAAT